jgi:hypothetical protein
LLAEFWNFAQGVLAFANLNQFVPVGLGKVMLHSTVLTVFGHQEGAEVGYNRSRTEILRNDERNSNSPGDRYPDIVLAALDNETFPIYQNDGKGGFTAVTSKTGMTLLSTPMSGYSVHIADFDNDGWKDIFVSRGDVQSPAMAERRHIDQPNTVFRNRFWGPAATASPRFCVWRFES